MRADRAPSIICSRLKFQRASIDTVVPSATAPNIVMFALIVWGRLGAKAACSFLASAHMSMLIRLKQPPCCWAIPLSPGDSHEATIRMTGKNARSFMVRCPIWRCNISPLRRRTSPIGKFNCQSGKRWHMNICNIPFNRSAPLPARPAAPQRGSFAPFARPRVAACRRRSPAPIGILLRRVDQLSGG